MHPKPPKCPTHISREMIPITPEPIRGFKFSRYAQLAKKTVERLREHPRWKCPVSGCFCCQTTRIEEPEPPLTVKPKRPWRMNSWPLC
jgi:hypothetical protein